MKYQVTVTVNIHPKPDGQPDSSGNTLYHSQQFLISGDKFSDIAPTIDGIYQAIQQIVEGNSA